MRHPPAKGSASRSLSREARLDASRSRLLQSARASPPPPCAWPRAEDPVTDKRTVTLEIAGAKYRMTSDADESHLVSLADLINERIDALGPKAQRTATPAQLLAVVALGLADDLLAAERRRREIEQLTRDAITSAIARIDERLEA